MTEPTTTDEREYLLGTHDKELRRLGFQHQVWSGEAAHGWERAGFRPGQTLLDIGCGPGYTTFDLARLVGERGNVVAVDLSQRFIQHLETQARARGVHNIRARVQDVTRLDLDAESIDGAYTRWVLCYLEQPEAVIDAVARALRPGGSFVVQDYLRYSAITLAPHSDAFRRVIEATIRSWRERGGDPDVGKRIPELMHRAGLRVTSIRPIVRLGRPNSALWQWPETFFRGYLPSLIGPGLISQGEADAFIDDWESRGQDPTAFFLTPPMIEVVGTRE